MGSYCSPVVGSTWEAGWNLLTLGDNPPSPLQDVQQLLQLGRGDPLLRWWWPGGVGWGGWGVGWGVVGGWLEALGGGLNGCGRCWYLSGWVGGGR